MKSPKTRCAGQWTESRFSGFIKSALRAASSRWAPKYLCLKNARTARNTYTCAVCEKSFGNKSIRVDHVEPVVDPVRGFRGWDEYIRRLFCELDGFQALCLECHAKKTLAEQIRRREIKTQCAAS